MEYSNVLDEALTALLNKENLGRFVSKSLLDGGGSSSHDNYLVETEKGKYVFRIVKDSGALNHTDLQLEYEILTLLKEYEVAPEAVLYTSDFLGKPALLESYVEGAVASSKVFPVEYISSCMDLFTKVSVVDVTENDFPFVFRYPSYEVSFSVWNDRIDVVRQIAPEIGAMLQGIADSGKSILTKHDPLLTSLPQSFIYNDVHPGNVIFETPTNKAKFIDWQKVSLGDPTFMVVLFGERFASVFGMEQEAFRVTVKEMYNKLTPIPQFETLYNARAYERAVSDLVWTAWVKAKKGEDIQGNEESFQKLLSNVAFWEKANSK